MAQAVEQGAHGRRTGHCDSVQRQPANIISTAIRRDTCLTRISAEIGEDGSIAPPISRQRYPVELMMAIALAIMFYAQYSGDIDSGFTMPLCEIGTFTDRSGRFFNQ